MRILFVNTSPPVVPVWEDSFPRMKERGLEPAALVSAADYRAESNREDGDDDDDSLVRLPCPSFAARRKLFRHFFYALLAPWRILSERPGGVVFLTQPPLFHVFGSGFCRLFGIPYAVHVMDQYPEVLEASGVIRRDGIVARLLRGMVRSSYRSARGIVTLGPCATALVRDDYGIEPGRLHEVPNWPFAGIEPVPREENEFLAEQGWGGDFVALYSGNLGLGHEVDTLAGLLERMRDREGIRFVFIGGGRGSEKLRERCGDLPNVEFLPFQPREKLAQTLSAASVHLITLREDFLGLMVPSKLYGCLASGRPVLFEGPASSSVALTIRDAGCGTAVRNRDAEALAATLEDYASDPDRVEREGAAARACYENHHEPGISAERYAACIRDLFPGEGREES